MFSLAFLEGWVLCGSGWLVNRRLAPDRSADLPGLGGAVATGVDARGSSGLTSTCGG